MSAAGGGGEPPIEPPFGKVRPSLVEWVESIFEDCMLYDRTIFCTCPHCERHFGKGIPVVTCTDPHMVEMGQAPNKQYSYIGFLNARREAAIQRDYDRMEAMAIGVDKAGEELAEILGQKPKTEANDRQAKANPKLEKRDPKEMEEPFDDLFRNE